ncbi:unnamed protein product [Amoebophrya sp. A120]|nr:unnamed protein product [Amoebophrya sp. A120]|eukprot:GSA120T00005947001.1
MGHDSAPATSTPKAGASDGATVAGDAMAGKRSQIESEPTVEPATVRTKLQIFTESGEPRSAGLEFTKEFTVRSVEPGGQAQQLGIQVGWQMVEFAGAAVADSKFKLKRVKKTLVEAGAREYEIVWRKSTSA